MKAILILIVTLSSVVSLATDKLIATGEIFEKDGTTKKFLYERYQSKDGDTIIDSTVYKDLDGDVLLKEKMLTKNGELVRYDIDQKQLKQKAWIEADQKNVTFNLKKFRKRNYPQKSKKPANFIVGLQIVPTVHKHWDALMKGEEKPIQLGVWHRQEAIAFNLKKDKEENGNMVVKMSPSSMFIRAVVDPIYFVFDKKTKNLTSYKGRVTPKEQRGRSFYDFDGIVRYKLVESEKSEKPGKAKESKAK